MEFDYFYHCSHLRSKKKEPIHRYLFGEEPPLFDEWATDNGYKVEEEPYATQKLFQVFNTTVKKKEFTHGERNNIINFIGTYYPDIVGSAPSCRRFRFEIRLKTRLYNYLDGEQVDAIIEEVDSEAGKYSQILDGAFMRLFMCDRKSYKEVMKSMRNASARGAYGKETCSVIKKYVKNAIKDLKYDWD